MQSHHIINQLLVLLMVQIFLYFPTLAVVAYVAGIYICLFGINGSLELQILIANSNSNDLYIKWTSSKLGNFPNCIYNNKISP